MAEEYWRCRFFFFNLTQLWRSWVAYRWPKCFVGFLQGACMREWVWRACIKKAFLWKEQRRAVWPQWKWMIRLFPAHLQPHLTCYLLYWRVRIWGVLVSSFFMGCLPFWALHRQILADQGGGVQSGSLQFTPREESLDSKWIWKQGGRETDREVHGGSSKLMTLRFPMGKGMKWQRQLQLAVTQLLCLCFLQSTRAFINWVSQF